MEKVRFSQYSKLMGMFITGLAITCFCLPIEAMSSPSEDGGKPEGNGRKNDTNKGAPLGDLYGDQVMLIRDVGVGTRDREDTHP